VEKKRATLKEMLSIAVFVGIIGVLFVINLVTPSPEILLSERRRPAAFPDVTFDTVTSGTFMSRFEDYAADHFVFRDRFREINAFLVFHIYRQNDMSGIYRSSEVGIGEFRRIDEVAFRLTSQRIETAAGIFDGLDMNIYYSIVPDKSIFAERYLPGFTLEKAEGIIHDVLGGYEYIRLYDVLSAGDFYRTDPHWDQSRISAATNHLLSSMGVNSVVGDYAEVTVGEFRGAFAGQIALPVAPDIMTYMDIPITEAEYIDERTLEFGAGPVYDISRFTGVDPYDVFLRGPQPLIILENKNAPERELYLFRDSFGSSLAPLLTSAYSRITVIDLRYVHLGLVEQLIDFKPGSDVLFIYSSQIFNNPSVLLV
jgi:hypothetical protein